MFTRNSAAEQHTTSSIPAQRSSAHAQSCDMVRLIISRSQHDQRQFQVKLERRGARAILGLLGPNGSVRGTAIQELRRHYERQLQMMHELALVGIPTPLLDETPLLALGRRVAELLPSNMRQEIVAVAQQAHAGRYTLRFTLEVANDTPDLLGIPWELMALPLGWGAPESGGEDAFLFLNANMALVRQVQGVGLNMPLALQRPLRLQAFAAAPQHVRAIDTAATMEAIRHAQPANDALSHWYDGCGTLSALQERLREASPQVVHLVCHGEQSDIGRGVPRCDLLLTHAEGYTQRAGAADLARTFTLARDLQLVVLQACHAGATAVSATDDGAQRRQKAESLALALVRAGVPAVVAMQGEVGQHAAAAFVRTCYALLAQGGTLDHAVAAGRLAMRAAGGIVDWSLPVIYQGSAQPAQNSWRTRVAARFEGLFQRAAVS